MLNEVLWYLNFQGVKILDMISKQRITNVPRDDISLRPDMYPCSLCWKDNLTLIIGWGNSVKVQLPVFVINACCYHRETEDYFWKAKTIEKNRIWFDYSVQNSCCHRNVIGLTLMRRRSDRHPAVRQICVWAGSECNPQGHFCVPWRGCFFWKLLVGCWINFFWLALRKNNFPQGVFGGGCFVSCGGCDC